MAVIHSIYDYFDMTLTSEVETRMRLYLVRNPSNKHGKHKYSMSEYGITHHDLLNNFDEYIQHFTKLSDNVL